MMTPYRMRLTQSAESAKCTWLLYFRYASHMYMYMYAVCKKWDEGFLQHVWIGSKTLIMAQAVDLPHTLTCPQKYFFEDLENGMGIAQL